MYLTRVGVGKGPQSQGPQGQGLSSAMDRQEARGETPVSSLSLSFLLLKPDSSVCGVLLLG